MLVYREKINKAKSRFDFIEKDIKKRELKIIDLNNRVTIISKSQVFVQNVAVNTQKLIKYRIEDIIQKAIDVCFPGEYVFDFDFKVNREKTEISFDFIKQGERENVKDESGGGLKNVLAFIFRVIVLSMSANRKTLFLDEPFAALSRNLHPLVGSLLKSLSEELGIQFIMNTHNKEMINFADRVFTINNKKQGDHYVSGVI